MPKQPEATSPAPPSPRRAAALLPILLVSTVVLFAGLTPVAAKDALLGLPPLSLGFLRFAIAAVLLNLTLHLRRRTAGLRREPVDRADLPRLVLAAVLCVPANQLFFLVGVQWANASHAGLLYALSPVLTYIFTLILGHTAASWRMGLATALAFTGAAVVGLDGLRGSYGRQFLAGDFLLLLAVASWAGYSVTAVPLVRRYGALRSVTLVVTLGAVLYSPALLIDGHRLDFAGAPLRALGGFAFLAIVTSYMNYLLWFVALRRVDINRLSVAVNASPLVAVVAAAVHHGEPITRWLLAAGAIILLAIVMANWDRLRRRPSS
jgi:drug/metabolite transporter (DMT)-like permease